MKDFKSFLKTCIAEVLIEPEAQQAQPIKGFRAFVKQCIAECIVEPDKKLRAVSIHGNPEKLEMARLIKECTMEVLKENLTEGFDPTSQGPNPVQDNPYPAWNATMRKLEEEDVTDVTDEAKKKSNPNPELQESAHSVNVPWTCPHCSKPAGIMVESESASDYIACADCEHCGKEINDPALDKAIYEMVLKQHKKQLLK